jgi:hypothetical protein
MNPFLYNEYILIKNFLKRRGISSHLGAFPYLSEDGCGQLNDSFLPYLLFLESAYSVATGLGS